MSNSVDAIIIGTGVIGAAIAFEMAKAGWKTLSLDRNAQAGHGSTSGSCAIVRMHYSTFDGTAFAWEGYHYWRDWAAYLGLPAEGHRSFFTRTRAIRRHAGLRRRRAWGRRTLRRGQARQQASLLPHRSRRRSSGSVN